ncbi:UDP-Glycosyltransferase/glycogen phosphorylase [Mytilinidion resinicola]|uniref:UDP-Glycosyltransferase/glycogen phosphorylase n=1 Tax=Mytilinidion resinicola TaxID=574789 RepID=A0A6A6YVT1_9PEZI|nr:UDP-Glycosyltransferase/glycogen phosphorylase [Mytilinidion resinicola]KAF2812483.1 UDP-Glycosyltransferase/glycogen phosphorylase [Mytilinidion resinicola]
MTAKSQTERPKVQTNDSLFFRTRSATAAKHNRNRGSLTYAFDPYSSDSSSSSSSDEEEPESNATPEHGRRTSSPKKKGRRVSSSAPFSRFQVGNEHFKTKGRVSKRDGRLKISLSETANTGYLAKALGAGVRTGMNAVSAKPRNKCAMFSHDGVEPEPEIPSDEDDMELHPETRVRLNIVVIVIGSRGDIQPFLKIGKVLKEEYGHRVRIATHPAFKKFVEQDSGLEFFSVGGNPSELMAFMVKNPGLIPSIGTVKAGEIGRRRTDMYNMFQGMWRACINSTDDETDEENMKMMGDKNPFIADAIIANPPSFAPPHIAERLGIPLHMMFTFPYTPTVHFPHPLANIKASNLDANYTNFMSYPLVEMMIWQGLGDLINKFRTTTLGLEQVSTIWAPGQLYRLRVPYTYMWSPSLVSKPSDWGPEIDIAGFVFLELASSFNPPEALTKFLEAGPPPVYIGFGSIVVDDPERFTKLIFQAVEMAGVRAIVSKGWGGLGDEKHTPDNIFMLENTPHDWLFPRVSAVVHHGGAGTTAIGLKCGKPTMIVPFFGDQPFWGAMVAKARAGAHECIPYKSLTVERLAEGIKQCLTDEARANAQKIAENIAKEGDGARNAVKSFHHSLPLKGEHTMRCDLLRNRVAVWQTKTSETKLSALAAEILVAKKKLKWSDMRLLRHYEWNDFGGPGEPLTGTGSAILGSITSAAKGVGGIPIKMASSVRKRKDHEIRKGKAKKRAKDTWAVDEAVVDGTTKHKKVPNGRPSGPERGNTTLSKLSADPEEPLVLELAQEAGHGFQQTGEALATAPMELVLAVAQGFHNAPRLYGDPTVRRPPRISGFHSGLRAGRDEFLFGIYDGVTGLWMQPYNGAKHNGVLGFCSGIGYGIGGFVLKDISAIIGPFAYTFKGIEKELKKGSQPTAFIRRARIIQGQKDFKALAAVDLTHDNEFDRKKVDEMVARRKEIEKDVLSKWKVVKKEVERERIRSHSTVRGRLGLAPSERKGGKHVPRKDEVRNSLKVQNSTLKRSREVEREKVDNALAPAASEAMPDPSELKAEAKDSGVGLRKPISSTDALRQPEDADTNSADVSAKKDEKSDTGGRSMRPSGDRERAVSDTMDWAKA